ncbi:hypothetical protein [Sphingopyxis sp.]|uniref:hypothetical protein n=1 Tax=Sphingopyxis sp. TaxID=1908224 RepID=UPI003D6C7919
MTVAAMLDAAGIIVHVGSEHYTSVAPDLIAVGGLRLTVPAWQFDDASLVLSEMLAAPAPVPNDYTVRALGRFALATIGFVGAIAIPYAFLLGMKSFLAILYTPLLLLQVPANVQGRSEYYHVAAPGD